MPSSAEELTGLPAAVAQGSPHTTGTAMLAQRASLTVVEGDMRSGLTCGAVLAPSHATAQSPLRHIAPLTEFDVRAARQRAQLQSSRAWLLKTLHTAAEQATVAAWGDHVGTFVLLNFLRDARKPLPLQYVIEADSEHRGMFVAGANVPVAPFRELRRLTCQEPVVFLVSRWWNWVAETQSIAESLRRYLPNCSTPQAWAIAPFPLASQRMEAVPLRAGDGGTVVLKYPYRPVDTYFQLDPSRPRVGMVTHFYNEAFLLPYFVNHHAAMFDAVILIDCGSTDAGPALVQRYAPSTWTVVVSKNPSEFHYTKVDDEVVEWENTMRGWKVALTTTEFLVHPNLRAYMSQVRAPWTNLMFHSIEVVGDDSAPLRPVESLVGQRHEYRQQFRYYTAYSRFIHIFGREMPSRYFPGRHAMNVPCPSYPVCNPFSREGFVVKFYYSPWPQIAERKLQIRSRIPQEHMVRSVGSQHNVTMAGLERVRRGIRATWRLLDAATSYARCNYATAMVHRMWAEVTGGDVTLAGDCNVSFPESLDVAP